VPWGLAQRRSFRVRSSNAISASLISRKGTNVMMKVTPRILVLVFYASLSFALAGCGASTAPQTVAADPQTVAAIERMDQNLQSAINGLRPVSGDNAVQSPRWEYELGSAEFDAECASLATAAHKNDTGVADALGLGAPGRLTMSWIGYTLSNNSGNSAVLQNTVDMYLQCGREALAAYVGQMGDEGWEMVTYEQQSTSATSMFPAVPFAYEVMWKRPKTAK
jgi:hypothetical protein